MSPKGTEERKKHLENRLAAYALAAAAALATSQTAEGAIQVYTDNTTRNNDGEYYDIAFNGETKFRIRLSKSTYTSFSGTWTPTTSGSTYTTTSWWTYKDREVGVYPQTTHAEFIGSSSSWASALAAGVVVDGSGTFTNYGTDDNMAWSYQGRWSNFAGGPFKGRTRYLGVRFQLSGAEDSHYGWIRVTVPNDVSSFTVEKHAYEGVPNLGIITGEEDVSLAVTLSSISAVIVRDGVKLVWITESEEDHLGFVIERREIDAAGKPLNPWAEISGYKTNEDLRGTGNSSNRKEYTFTDVNALNGVFYEYRLSDVNLAGVTKMRRIVRVDQTTPEIPEAFVLDQNYPNPFNPETTIRFGVPEDSDVRVAIYNQVGQLVEVLVDRQMKTGYHTVKWDASDRSSGTYLCEFQSNGRREVKKLMLIR